MALKAICFYVGIKKYIMYIRKHNTFILKPMQPARHVLYFQTTCSTYITVVFWAW
jgi:hypothetical protein